MTDVHKYHGYSAIFISQLAMSMGMCYFLIKQERKDMAIGLTIGNAVLFASIIATLEILN